jgi:hypothetical protein
MKKAPPEADQPLAEIGNSKSFGAREKHMNKKLPNRFLVSSSGNRKAKSLTECD